MEKPIYSVNYSTSNTIRTVETKCFDLLRDAKALLENVNGYILRLQPNAAKVLLMNNFQPSAAEGEKIKKILGAWND